MLKVIKNSQDRQSILTFSQTNLYKIQNNNSENRFTWSKSTKTQWKQKERKSLFNPVAEFVGQRNGARIKRASWRGGKGGDGSNYEDEVCKGVARPSRWYHASSIQTASLSALSSDLSSPPCSAPFRSSSRLLRLASCLHEDPPAYLLTLTTFEPPPREMAKKALDAWPCEGSRSIDQLRGNLGRWLVAIWPRSGNMLSGWLVKASREIFGKVFVKVILSILSIWREKNFSFFLHWIFL